MEETKKDNPIVEAMGCIVWVIVIALIFFLMYHWAELAQIILDKLR
jgi:hypothetical protein